MFVNYFFWKLRIVSIFSCDIGWRDIFQILAWCCVWMVETETRPWRPGSVVVVVLAAGRPHTGPGHMVWCQSCDCWHAVMSRVTRRQWPVTRDTWRDGPQLPRPGHAVPAAGRPPLQREHGQRARHQRPQHQQQTQQQVGSTPYTRLGPFWRECDKSVTSVPIKTRVWKSVTSVTKMLQECHKNKNVKWVWQECDWWVIRIWPVCDKSARVWPVWQKCMIRDGCVTKCVIVSFMIWMGVIKREVW